MDFGVFENRSYEMMKNDADYIRWLETNCEGMCPGGEDKAGFSRRVCDAFEAVIRAAALNGEDTVFIVAHGGTVMAVMEHYAPERKPYFDWHVGPGTGYRLDVECGTGITVHAHKSIKGAL